METTIYTCCSKCRKPLLHPVARPTHAGRPSGSYAFCVTCKASATACSIWCVSRIEPIESALTCKLRWQSSPCPFASLPMPCMPARRTSQLLPTILSSSAAARAAFSAYCHCSDKRSRDPPQHADHTRVQISWTGDLQVRGRRRFRRRCK